MLIDLFAVGDPLRAVLRNFLRFYRENRYPKSHSSFSATVSHHLKSFHVTHCAFRRDRSVHSRALSFAIGHPSIALSAIVELICNNCNLFLIELIEIALITRRWRALTWNRRFTRKRQRNSDGIGSIHLFWVLFDHFERLGPFRILKCGVRDEIFKAKRNPA